MNLAELWAEVRGHRVSPPKLASFTADLPDQDDENDDGLHSASGEDTTPPDWTPQSISGHSIILHYRDSRGAQSARQVECKRLSERAGTGYLHAWCFERGASRSFRIDRIVAVVDPITGEITEPGSLYLARFSPDEISAAPFNLGLPPRLLADLNAGLNVLTFIARCDQHWHPLEAESILAFVAAWWMRADIRADLDERAVLQHATRLSPDAETFITAVHRCRNDDILAGILRRHAASVIEADGFLHDAEIFWGEKIDRIFTLS